MYRTKILLTFLALIILIPSSWGQKAGMVTSNSKEFPGKVINVKWVTDSILFKEGVNIYRKVNDIPIWVKLNEEPITLGKYQVPDSAFLADTSLQQYIDFATGAGPQGLEGMARAFFLLEMVYSNEFAKFIGTEYDDTAIVAGNMYQYMVKRIKGSKELFVGVSEPLKAGPFIAGDAPTGVRAEGLNKKVNLWWNVENDRFHSINIYRYSNYSPVKEKINSRPVVLAERVGPDGKLGYPDVYFTDKDVNNDTNYFYSIAGIDFFGRETKYTGPVMASPRNRTPPPAATMNNPKVNLLDVELSWVPGDMKKVVGYNIYKSPSIYQPFTKITEQPLSTVAVRFNDKVDKPGYYYYYVTTVDKNGNEGKSNMVMAEIMDIWPPPVPQKLTARADSGTITLTWGPVEEEHLAGYRIYRTVDANNKAYYVLINADPVKDTVFVDRLPFNARNKFYYSVVSVDTSLNMSDFSKPVSAVLPDMVPPDVPFIKEIKVVDNKGLEVNWLKNLDADLNGYNLFREEIRQDSAWDAQKINPVLIEGSKTSYIDFNVEKGVQYKYYLQALDSIGNRSGYSNKFPAVIELPPVRGLAELQNVSVGYNEKRKEVEISWKLPQGIAAKGVVVFRSDTLGSPMLPVSGLIKTQEFTEAPPKNGKEFTYRLESYSATGEKWQSGIYKVNVEGKNE
jgi:uncharacterized protein